MVESENKLFRRLEPGTALAREQQRLKALLELGLLEAQTIPVFEEATQTAAYLLDSPICILGFLDQNRYWFKSAVGLSRLGLMNQLAQERQLPRHEDFSAQVVETHQVLAITDTLSNPAFAKKLLVQHYGIRAYLGVPLLSASGYCLGAIAVMDLEPRNFTIRDIKFLELIARWSMSEFERNQLLKTQDTNSAPETLNTPQPASQLPNKVIITATSSSPDLVSTTQIKLELLAQLTQELRTPLTSVLGMAGVVSREIYGPLTNKQKEYLEIIQNSGRYLLSLVNEISALGLLDDSTQALNVTSVDIEMLCQQALNTLEEPANRREQEIRLSVEPGRSRIFVLDKDKVRQLLYHLVFSVIQAASTGSVIHIHVSYKDNDLNLAVSVSHPWLGNGLSQVDPYFCQLLMPVVSTYSEAMPHSSGIQVSDSTTTPVPPAQPSRLSVSSSDLLVSSASSSDLAQPNSFNRSHESLRLLLSCYLAELHGGHISIQGSPELGYRYVVSLPEMEAAEASL